MQPERVNTGRLKIGRPDSRRSRERTGNRGIIGREPQELAKNWLTGDAPCGRGHPMRSGLAEPSW